MSHKSRLRRIEAGVRWLETEGVLIRGRIRMKIAQTTEAIVDHTARPKARPPARRPKAAPRVPPLRREAAVPAAPREEAGAEPAPLPGQPVAPPPPDMEIRPVRWRPRGESDYEEEDRPGTNGRCITEYDPLRDEDDDDDDW